MRGILLDRWDTNIHSTVTLALLLLRFKNGQPWLHHSVLQSTRMKDVELITRSTVKFQDSIVAQSFRLSHQMILSRAASSFCSAQRRIVTVSGIIKLRLIEFINVNL